MTVLVIKLETGIVSISPAADLSSSFTLIITETGPNYQINISKRVQVIYIIGLAKDDNISDIGIDYYEYYREN